MTRLLALFALAVLLAGCGSSHSPPDADVNPDLHDFATRYTAAWSSQDPARGFMVAFPNMVVAMDALRVE